MLQNAEPDAPDLEHLKCAICMELCDRPVTAPCQHNACLGCFRRWTNQGKKQCPTCRAELTKAVIQNPRINTMLTVRIRQARKVRALASMSQFVAHRTSDFKLCLDSSQPVYMFGSRAATWPAGMQPGQP